MLFNLVFCEKQIPRFARDDNEVLFFRKLSSRAELQEFSRRKAPEALRQLPGAFLAL
jgi:hypothetical protein